LFMKTALRTEDSEFSSVFCGPGGSKQRKKERMKTNKQTKNLLEIIFVLAVEKAQ